MTGPFETEREAAALPAVRDARQHAAYDTRPGVLTAGCHRMLCEALTAAGVTLGAWDHQIVAWLAAQGPETCAVVAGWASRARASAAADVADLAGEAEGLAMAARRLADGESSDTIGDLAGDLEDLAATARADAG